MKNLRNTVFFKILIPTALIFFSIIIISLIIFNNSYKQNAINIKITNIANVSRSINDWLISRLSEIILLSKTYMIREKDLYEIMKFLEEESNRLPFIYDRLWYIKPDASYINTNHEEGILENPFIIKDLLLPKKYFLYIAPILLKPNENFVLFIGVPITKDNEIQAILSASIKLSSLNRLVSGSTFNMFDEVMLVNPTGEIIFHSNNNYNGKKENTVYNQVFSSNTEYKDKMVFVSVLKTSWKLVGIIKKEIIFSPLTQINIIIILAGIIIIFIIGFISIVISNTVVKPIKILTSMVNKMMQGRFNQEIKLNREDELNELALAFNLLNKKLLQIKTDDRFIFLGHISARMAHEIRKPLNIIKLATQMIKKRNNNIKNADLIFKEVENADKFIQQILGFTKEEKLNITYYSVCKLLDKVIYKFNLILEEKKIKINFLPYPEIPKIYFDVFKMEQVFSNIISNSIDSIGEQGEIIISVSFNNKNIIIEFFDSGTGFPKNIIDKIYEPYFTTKKNGSGLGLSICYRILMAHGAKIEVGNRQSGGAVARIIFDYKANIKKYKPQHI